MELIKIFVFFILWLFKNFYSQWFYLSLSLSLSLPLSLSLFLCLSLPPLALSPSLSLSLSLATVFHGLRLYYINILFKYIHFILSNLCFIFLNCVVLLSPRVTQQCVVKFQPADDITIRLIQKN